jgi:hypothetical protein
MVLHLFCAEAIPRYFHAPEGVLSLKAREFVFRLIDFLFKQLNIFLQDRTGL